MERQYLYKLIENNGTSSKEETSDLWEIVRTYPYFQTARMLLVKSFHNQGSIHFHNELKAAAAYSADRKTLFHLINDERTKQTTDEKSNIFVIEEEKRDQKEAVLKPNENLSENPFALSEEREEHIEAPVFEIKEEASSFTENKIEATTPEIKYFNESRVEKEEAIERKERTPEHLSSSFDEPVTSNEEIIRKRLSEILAKNKPEQKTIISEVTPPKVEEPTTRKEKEEVAEERPPSFESPVVKEEVPETHSVLDKLPAEPKDEIEGLEIETIIEENYLQELEKLPEIVKPDSILRGDESVTSHAIQSDSSQLSFIDWLKLKNGKETTLEEVLDDETVFQPTIHPPPTSDMGGRGALIDKFIATAPRIVPAKAEFYSPANMARLSIIDNEDIISETLAQIYFDQENYLKARSCYEKLSLLYPEKSASFAALIEKIDNILNQIKD